MTVEVDYDDLEIGLIGATAVQQAAQISRYYDFFGPAFQGVLSIDLSPFGNFGNTLGDHRRRKRGPSFSALPDPEFEPAQAEALVNASGQITQIVITEPGAFYHGTPTLYLNNDPGFDSNVTFTMGRTVVTWAAVTTWQRWSRCCRWSRHSRKCACNLGSHGTRNRPQLSACGMRIVMSRTCLRQRVTKARGLIMETHFHLWVEEECSGDLTISSKVFLKGVGHFGLNGGTGANSAVDVAHLLGAGSVESSGLNEANAPNANTFPIYRHDYGSAPYPLRTGRFNVIPSHSMPADLMDKLPLDLSIGARAERAVGLKVMVLRYNSCLPLPKRLFRRALGPSARL